MKRTNGIGIEKHVHRFFPSNIAENIANTEASARPPRQPFFVRTPMIEENIDIAALEEFDRQPIAASIETDRFCEKCGYNLRTCPIRRDGRTGVLLCRCPECGRFHPARVESTAGSVWLQRLGTLGLFLWIIIILALCFGLSMVQLGATIGMLEELSYVDWSDGTIFENSQTARLPNGRLQVTFNGKTFICNDMMSDSAYFPRYVREEEAYDSLFKQLMHGLGFLAGFLMFMLLSTALHHWRKWAYLLPALFVPALIGIGLYYYWSVDYPYLLDWAGAIILSIAGANVAGNLTGIVFGRRFARLACTVMLPRKTRQVMAFLWIADGMSPPTVRAD